MQNMNRAQLSKVRDRAQAVASAEKLLECVPSCMLTFPEVSRLFFLEVEANEDSSKSSGAHVLLKRSFVGFLFLSVADLDLL